MADGAGGPVACRGLHLGRYRIAGLVVGSFIAEIRAERERARQDPEGAKADTATNAAGLRQQLSDVRAERDTIRARLDAEPALN